MTAPARITQADMERVTKSLNAANIRHGRIVYDFAKARIEVIIGESASTEPENPWDDDDAEA